MAEQTVNPDLVLECARMAIPERKWYTCKDHGYFKGKPIYVNGDVADPGNCSVIGGHFDIEKKGNDFRALLVCLMREGWRFRYENGGSLGDVFWAENPHQKLTIWSGEMSRLLLASIAAQTNIPMWLE